MRGYCKYAGKVSVLVTAILIFFIASCKEESVSTGRGLITPPTVNWILDYYDYNIGTLYCTWPNPCFIDVVTDTIDLTNNDSIRIIIRFHSVRKNALTITKVPYPVEFYNCTFPDSAYGVIEETFTSFKAKVLIDFGFDVGTKITIDTLQIFKK